MKKRCLWTEDFHQWLLCFSECQIASLPGQTVIYEFCVFSCAKFPQKTNFFESLQLVQSVVYKSSYLLKYELMAASSSGEYVSFSITLQLSFYKKVISFPMGLLSLLGSKTFDIHAVSLDFPSEFVEVIFLFFIIQYFLLWEQLFWNECGKNSSYIR